MRRMDDLIGEFISETSESLAALERALADQARQPLTADGWKMAARLMHTIKGTCGFLQLPTMEKVAARSQDILERRSGGDAPNEGELVELRAAMAQIRYMMDHLAQHGVEPPMSETEMDALPPAPTLPAAAPAPEPELEPKIIIIPAAADIPAEPIIEITPTPPPRQPKPASTVEPAKPYPALNEQVHRAPEPLPDLPPPAQPVTRVPEPVPGGERVSHSTLSTLVMARNQLRAAASANGKVRQAQSLLDGLIRELEGKLLPRTASYPRLARVLMVESGGMRFALTSDQIREVARIAPNQRHAELEDGAMISLRGSWLPRVSLAQKLGQASSAGEAYALVIDSEGKRLALCVETIGELETLMLQKLPSLLQHKRVYEAAAILGDGSPCLILSSKGLLQQTARTPRPPIIDHTPHPRLIDVPTEDAAPAPRAAAAPTARTSTAFLLFGDGTATAKAIPLADVGRVEHLRAADVAPEADDYAIACRGEILRLKLLPGSLLPEQGDFHAITLLDAPGTGIVAHRMGGIYESQIDLPAAGKQPFLLRAELDGALTDIVNAQQFMPEASHG